MSRLTMAGIIIAVAALVFVLLSGPGYRMGWWSFRRGLLLFGLGGLLAMPGFLLSALGVWRDHAAQRGIAAGIAGIVVSLALLAFAGSAVAGGKGKPRIHDISTDLADPPRFTAILPLRGTDSNPVEPNPKVADLQRKAYGDIQPLVVGVPPAEAFRRATAAVEASQLELISSRPGDGIIEATATTKFFGFHDDVVIRIRPEGTGSRVDIRSTSRVGIGDLGVNAARIRKLLAAIAK